MNNNLALEASTTFCSHPELNEHNRVMFDIIRMFRLYDGNVFAFIGAHPEYKIMTKELASAFAELAPKSEEELIELTMEVIKNA